MAKSILTFKRYEFFSIVGILLVLFSATFINLGVSLRRSRDAQRKSDLRSIADSLVKFQNDFSNFPFAQDQKIAACVEEGFDATKLGPADSVPFVACQWGEDQLKDVTDANYAPYSERLPRDPKSAQGIDYLYISNGKRFQLFAHLEGGADDNEYKPEVEARGLMCGIKICNFGVGFSTTPLDKTLEEYENELSAQENEQK